MILGTGMRRREFITLVGGAVLTPKADRAVPVRGIVAEQLFSINLSPGSVCASGTPDFANRENKQWTP